MIKLADFIKKDEQPGEEVKMKNFLYRGSKDQIDTHKKDINLTPNRYNVVGSKPGTIENKGMIDTSDHPENHNYKYPWSWEQPDGLFEEEESERVRQALIGREVQSLEEVAKVISRLKQAGFAESDIKNFIINFIF